MMAENQSENNVTVTFDAEFGEVKLIMDNEDARSFAHKILRELPN